MCDWVAVIAALARYWLTVRLWVGPELRRWERRAMRIPDPVLRDLALFNLRGEGLNPEGVAVFATLVPLRDTPRLTRLMVTLQVTFDYLDSVSEQPTADVFANTARLHEALIVALQPAAPPPDYYAFAPQREDGGYLAALVAACQAGAARLPSLAAVQPAALHAGRRLVEAQAHTHAAIYDGTTELAAWASRQDRAGDYRWWEVAAAGISSLGIAALLAAAAWPGTTAEEAARIDAVYFPGVCAFSALLDSLSDHQSDSQVASLNSVAQYASGAEAAQRLPLIAARTYGAAHRLRAGRRHAAILAGIAGFYLSGPTVDTAFARPVREAIAAALEPALAPIMATMRLRRRLGG